MSKDIQQMVRVDLRTIVMDVPTQDVISRDNVSVKVSAVIYFRVMDPEKTIIEPLDKSMPPEMMTIAAPSAKIPSNEVSRKMSCAFRRLIRSPSKIGNANPA